MKERLTRLYLEHKITAAGLKYWVDKGIITQADMDEIISQNPVDVEDVEIEELTDAAYYANRVMNGAINLGDVPEEYRTEVSIRLSIGG